ncbi:hypothetical protein BSKO_06357 [Bryopsis sp. KO-2023]|nr:hypothetical protein BSKO_06357 [Bryopsis sp. KO-2023]
MFGLIAIVLLFLNFGLYAVFQIVAAFVYKPQDLKKKYDAEWALVTGASSGIGKSIAWKLASQGLNVVLVSLPEKLLHSTADEIRSAFPKVEVKTVEADLSGDGYMETIKVATKDINIQCVFNNAGYMVTGFFHESPLERQEKNLHCNVTSCVKITHHFINQMIEKKLRGCVVFTSSPAGIMPGPFAVLYAATKSFLSVFGASVAGEVKSKGIDVMVFHPSPVASRFYENQKKIGALEFFKKFAKKPDDLPEEIFSCIGRTVWADLGPTAMMFRLITKVIDYNALATMISFTAHTMADFKRQSQEGAAGGGSTSSIFGPFFLCMLP